MSETPNALTPEEVIRAQLEAYNVRDLNAFMKFWADDAKIYSHPDILLADGAAAIRERHRIRFEEPNLRAHLLQRISMGNIVIDRERVERTFPEGPGTLEVIGIYEVAHGQIAKAWFLLGERKLV